MQTYVRGYVPDDARAAMADAKPGTPIRFVASTEGVARDKLTIAQDGWQLTNYRANPAFLWVHDYMGQRPPIGRTEHVKVEDGKLVADVVFDQGDDFAREIERKYRAGFLSAVSVGWDTIEFEPTNKDDPFFGGGKVTKAELLDISAVPIPGDPKALMERQKRALADFGRDLLDAVDPDPATRHLRGAIPYKKTPLADEGADWDANAELGKCDGGADYRAVCAWVDGEGDPDQRQSYKFPHHRGDGEHECVWRGVAAGMGRLSSADMPEADKRGVYAHLSRHYDDFGKEPPAFRAATEPPLRATWEETARHMVRLLAPFAQRPDGFDRDAEYRRLAREYARHKRTPPEPIGQDALDAMGPEEVRGLFLENEPDLFPDLFDRIEARAGAVLSKRNQDDLGRAIELIQGVLSRAKKEPDAKPDDDKTDDERAMDYLQSLADQLAETAA